MSIAEYDRYDALGLAELVRRREVSAAELLEEAIARAERINPRINAIVIPMYDIARERVQEPLREGPFGGVPFLLKDISAAYAGVPLQAGSRLYRGYLPKRHSVITERYLDAGFTIFGKTSTPELGILPSTEPQLYGATHNPWKHGISPGGSSGGAAAAVAAGIVPMAHGSDGGGSIRIPASCCGLFGFKPTRGRTPCGPDDSELFFGFAIEHVLSRTVRDSAAALDATTGLEPTAMWAAPPAQGSFLAATSRPPGRLRIAFTTKPILPGEPHQDCTRAVQETAALLESLGHHVEEARPKLNAEAAAKAFFYHFAAGIAAELIAAESHLGRPTRRTDVERETWLLAMVGRSIDAPTFVLARRALMEAQRAIATFFCDYDILLTPTLGLPPQPLGSLFARGAEGAVQDAVARLNRPELLRAPGLMERAVNRAYAFAPYTPLINVTGQPSASVPLMWNDDGLPIGSMLTGRFGEDETVLSVCAQLETARPWRDRRAPMHA